MGICRTGVCEVGRLGHGWAPGMQLPGRVMGVMGVGANNRVQGYHREGGWKEERSLQRIRGYCQRVGT